MKKYYFSFLVLMLIMLIQSCGSNEEKKTMDKQKEREKVIKDSIELVKTIQRQREQAVKDSIIEIEQNVALGDILFDISEKEFNKRKGVFLKKCRLPEYEFYKGLTIITYKLGEYGFGDMYGWFYRDSLYNIRLRGPIVDYDEYDRIMPDQFEALMNLLKAKYSEPSSYLGLPKWNELEKGYFRRCAIWNIGSKTIEVRISCEGVKYYLNLEVYKPETEIRIQKEKDRKENEATKNAVDLM